MSAMSKRRITSSAVNAPRANSATTTMPAIKRSKIQGSSRLSSSTGRSLAQHAGSRFFGWSAGRGDRESAFCHVERTRVFCACEHARVVCCDDHRASFGERARQEISASPSPRVHRPNVRWAHKSRSKSGASNKARAQTQRVDVHHLKAPVLRIVRAPRTEALEQVVRAFSDDRVDAVGNGLGAARFRSRSLDRRAARLEKRIRLFRLRTAARCASRMRDVAFTVDPNLAARWREQAPTIARSVVLPLPLCASNYGECFSVELEGHAVRNRPPVSPIANLFDDLANR